MNNPIILFDGVCNLCSGLVNFIIKHDKKRIFRFSPLQSEFAQIMLKNFAGKPIPDKTVILTENSRILVKSDAVLTIVKYLGGFWKYFGYLKFIPAPIRDFVYDLIAENRYRLFGKRKTCMIPDDNVREFFL